MSKRLTQCFLTALLLAGGTAGLPASEPVSLTVTVAGVKPHQGAVSVTLFENEENYLKKAFRNARADVNSGESVDVIFDGLEPGTYAASVYYDLDNDGELDTGVFRIPKEPVGFSNNVKGSFGPAKWKKTRFELEQDLHIVVNLVNAND